MKQACVCGAEIPEERLELGLTTCVAHSRQSPSQGFMMYGHKTAGEVVIINGGDPEKLRQARNCYERKR